MKFAVIVVEFQNVRIWFVPLLPWWQHALRLVWIPQIPYTLTSAKTKAKKNNKTRSHSNPFLNDRRFARQVTALFTRTDRWTFVFSWIAFWTVGEWCFSPAAQKHSGWWRCFALCIDAAPCEKVHLAISSCTSHPSLRENCNTKVMLVCTLFWWFTVVLKVKRQPLSDQSGRTGTKHTLVVFHVAPRWGWHKFPLERWQWTQHSMPFPPD